VVGTLQAEVEPLIEVVVQVYNNLGNLGAEEHIPIKRNVTFIKFYKCKQFCVSCSMNLIRCEQLLPDIVVDKVGIVPIEMGQFVESREVPVVEVGRILGVQEDTVPVEEHIAVERIAEPRIRRGIPHHPEQRRWSQLDLLSLDYQVDKVRQDYNCTPVETEGEDKHCQDRLD